MSAPKRLVVLMRGVPIGLLEQGLTGKISFSYDQEWLDRGGGALSLSMPRIKSRHDGPGVANFFWGLLPENPMALQRIASEGDPVSPGNVMGLLDRVGDDLAGAIQVVSEARLHNVGNHGDVEWLSDSDIADRLRALRSESGRVAGLAGLRAGRHSLAGAQPKIALYRDGERWGIPSGRVPTTHIIKVPIQGLAGQAENEHFCLCLARAAGLDTAASEVVSFGTEKAIVIARFDRWTTPNGQVMRLHQEDMCQALGLHPNQKYQSDHGSTGKMIAEKVLSHSVQAAPDRRSFLQALMLNATLLGTDAHAKNYAVLYGRGGQFRLAPLYDLNSFLPYARGDERLCMSIGGVSDPVRVYPRHWERQARECGVPSAVAKADIEAMMTALPELCRDVAAGCRRAGLSHPVIDMLHDQVARQAVLTLRRLRNAPSIATGGMLMDVG